MDERMTLRAILKEMMNGLFRAAGPDNPEIQKMMGNFNLPKLHAGDGRMVGCWFCRGSWTAVSKFRWWYGWTEMNDALHTKVCYQWWYSTGTRYRPLDEASCRPLR